MSDGSDTDSRPGREEQGRTQTGRALTLVVVVALLAVLVLRHTGTSAAGTARQTARAVGARVASPTTVLTPAPSSTTTTTLPPIAPADTTVEVLNGLEGGTLASNLSGRLRQDGYKTLAPDNATTLTETSAIYVVEAAYSSSAAKLAATLGLQPGAIRITPDLPSTAPVPVGASTGADLIVLIGTSLQTLASSPVTFTPPASATTSTVAPTSTTVAKTTAPGASTTTTTARKATSPSASTTPTTAKTAARTRSKTSTSTVPPSTPPTSTTTP